MYLYKGIKGLVEIFGRYQFETLELHLYNFTNLHEFCDTKEFQLNTGDLNESIFRLNLYQFLKEILLRVTRV